jgi:hypothetical protein
MNRDGGRIKQSASRFGAKGGCALLYCALIGILPEAIAGPAIQVPFVVVPSNYSNSIAGTFGATYPFSTTSMRYQQVFASPQFSKSYVVTEIAFRPHTSSGIPFFPSPVSNVKIVLSTTTNNPGGLSTNFANNLGSDQIVVYNSSPSFSTSYTSLGGGPNAFDLRIHLAAPFTYNPTNGNLLMDVTITNSWPTNPPAFDAETTSANPLTSRLYATNGAATNGTADNSALITQFASGSFSLPMSTNLPWGIFNGTVTAIANDPTTGANKPLALQFFNHVNTLIGGSPMGQPIPSGYNSATAMASFGSFADFQAAIQTNGITAVFNGNAVLYDNESTGTPKNEQTNAAAYMALFANLAHACGYTYVSAPGEDLANVQRGYNNNLSAWQNYLNFGFPAEVASAPADEYDIQAQSQESSSSDFTNFIFQAAIAARQVNPSIQILVGISSQVSDGATMQNLFSAVTSTFRKNGVGGYWLSNPDPNTDLCTNLLYMLSNAGYGGYLANIIPTNLAFSVTANQLTLSWPIDHIGWCLQTQTNTLAEGLGTNWVRINTSTNVSQMVVPIVSTNGCVIYRMVYP